MERGDSALSFSAPVEMEGREARLPGAEEVLAMTVADVENLICWQAQGGCCGIKDFAGRFVVAVLS